jgi:hypothetical protein
MTVIGLRRIISIYFLEGQLEDLRAAFPLILDPLSASRTQSRRGRDEQDQGAPKLEQRLHHPRLP